MKVHKEMFNRWNKYCALWLHENKLTNDFVDDSTKAWNIATRLDIPYEAYSLGLDDSHIKTALKRIFPKAFNK